MAPSFDNESSLFNFVVRDGNGVKGIVDSGISKAVDYGVHKLWEYNNVGIPLDGWWNRPEDLLIEGRKDRDFSAKDALQPVLKLLLRPDGEELRNLTIKEAVRVIEAIVLGSVTDT